MIERVTPRLKRSWGQRSVIAMNLVLIALALGSAALLNYGYGRAASINRVALGRSLTPVPEHLEPGERVMNVLLVGSDSSANLDEDDPIQIGRRGERFGDVIIVAHIDERTSDIALLSLPRDLWVDVAGANRPSRINRAFEVGGPATLIKTIEDEFDIPIHHYVNVDFAGFQGLVSAVGSVDIFFETPARDWNVNARPLPRSQTGFLVEEAGCRSLDPETALAYVRSRYYQTQNESGDWITDPSSDLGRIRRQQDFLRRLLQKAIEMGARNPFVLRDLIDTGLDNVAIDQALTPQLLVDLGFTYRSFDPDGLQTYSFPATDGRVGRNQVLLPLRNEAQPLLNLFAGAGFESPETVALTVRVAPGTIEDPDRKGAASLGRSAAGVARTGSSGKTSSVNTSPTTTTPATSTSDNAGSPNVNAARIARLRVAGFEFEPTTREDLPVGVVLRHGPDGRHGAELVADTLQDTVRFEQVEGLVGRSVVLLLGPAEAAEPDAAAAGRSPSAATDGLTTSTPGPASGATFPGQIGAIPDQDAGAGVTGLESDAATCG